MRTKTSFLHGAPLALLTLAALGAGSPARAETLPDEPIIPIRRGPGVELQLQAGLLHVQSAISSEGAAQQVYVGFHVKNVGTNDAVASQVVINCTPATASVPAYGGVCESTGTLVFGIPALAPGAFFDFSLPERGIEVSQLFLPSTSAVSFSESITVQVQSPQVADPSIGTVVLTDGCDGTYPECAAWPAPPTFTGNNPGLLGTPFGLGTYYTWVNPTLLWMGAYSPGSTARLGSVPLYGGGVTEVDCSLTTPELTEYLEVPSAESANIVLDGNVVGTCIPGVAGKVAVSLPAFDTNPHTLQLTFAGDTGIAPTVSTVITFGFTLLIPKVPITL